MATRKHAIYRLLPEPSPDAAGAGCYLSGLRGPCVDTGALIYNEGTLTLSLESLQELCEVAGFSFSAEGQLLEEVNALQEHELTELRAKVTDLEEQLEAVGKAIARAAQKPVDS